VPARDPRLSTKLRLAPTRYEPIERLAVGGMAEVWRADAIFETGDRAPVAIKRVLPQLAANQLYRSMFEDEARLGMLLRHPSIVRVYDARDIRGTYIMVMELVDGSSLRSMLGRAHARRAGMPVAAALHIVREVAQALDYAHTAADQTGKPLGIIHRDVSPHNVLLGRDGAVKLADFGLANASVHVTEKSPGVVGGKLGYLAPEVVLRKPATARADVFAAGIVLWEALAGRRLFAGADDAETVRNVARCQVEPPSKLNSAVPKAVDFLLERILARDPELRIPSARALHDEINDVLDRLKTNAGTRDIALLVGLHLATERQRMPADANREVAAALMSELDAFAEQAAGSQYDVGALPLDPSEFDGIVPTRFARFRPPKPE